MKNTGLALGGGAVLGAAHVGTVRAIEELNIRIHYIAGTSIGAFVAAFYAFGKNWKELEKIASVMNWLDITGISLSRYGLLSNEKLGDMVIEQIGDKNIEDSEIPLAMVATDITTGEKVILKKGSVAQAVRASTCIPGIFMPVEIDGQMLVDGGVVENVPVNTVKEMGAEYVIGVDLNAKYSYEKPDNILDVILNSFNFLMLQSDKLQTDNADLLIKPDLSSFNRSDTDQVDELMKKGYEDSINVLKKIT
ncbi:MAG: patatin-like phospholipase family protein [Bacteroidetes bacterium]|jgi:NTE family protein|nr:patatin-like phospholipase family protein [Bacteroidota bacterium]